MQPLSMNSIQFRRHTPNENNTTVHSLRISSQRMVRLVPLLSASSSMGSCFSNSERHLDRSRNLIRAPIEIHQQQEQIWTKFEHEKYHVEHLKTARKNDHACDFKTFGRYIS